MKSFENSVPMAPVDPSSVWPVVAGEGIFNSTAQANHLRSAPWAFGSIRDAGRRRTIGPTLFGSTKDTVVAPVRARVIRSWRWEPGVAMVMLATERLFIGLATTAPRVVLLGTDLEAGAPIGAPPGECHGTQKGSQLIMFDRPEGLADLDFIARCAAPGFFVWRDAYPEGLLDPTEFLLDTLSRRSLER